MKWGAEAKALIASGSIFQVFNTVHSILIFRTLSDTADMSGPAAWPAPGESYTESSSCSRAGPSTGNWSEIFFEPVKMLALNIYSALSRPRSTIYPHRNIAMSSWWWSHGSSDREWKVWQDYTWLNISAQLRSSSTLGHVPCVFLLPCTGWRNYHLIPEPNCIDSARLRVSTIHCH